ncbi:MAG TPA: hypothetical protein DDZ41_11860, partial [Flavobacterium sp.]|nr:hypothetical protein [Flavobacterium sp.]
IIFPEYFPSERLVCDIGTIVKLLKFPVVTSSEGVTETQKGCVIVYADGAATDTLIARGSSCPFEASNVNDVGDIVKSPKVNILNAK